MRDGPPLGAVPESIQHRPDPVAHSPGQTDLWGVRMRARWRPLLYPSEFVHEGTRLRVDQDGAEALHQQNLLALVLREQLVDARPQHATRYVGGVRITVQPRLDGVQRTLERPCVHQISSNQPTSTGDTTPYRGEQSVLDRGHVPASARREHIRALTWAPGPRLRCTWTHRRAQHAVEVDMCSKDSRL